MKDLTRRLFNPIGNGAIEREVNEELRFHLELLTEQHLQHGGTVEEARAAALKSFGDVEQVKDECVEISKRKHPFTRALKSFFILVFLAGVFVRILGTELHVDRVGTMLITIAVIGRLFLYVRGLRPAVFRPKTDSSSALILNSTFKTATSLFETTFRK